jgi:hypothetical protein
MRTWERLRKTKDWVYQEICAGRDYKVPKNNTRDGYGADISDFTRGEPNVYLAWQPMRPDTPGQPVNLDPYNVAPSITIMPTQGYIRYMEEKRFDRYSNIHRPQDMGQTLGMQFLFTIYEPGVRWPGFAESMQGAKPDMSLLKDGTEAGLMQLVDWMDDFVELVLRERNVPNTDLILEDDTSVYSLYTDQNYVVDRRPYYYGFVNIQWRCYANYGSDKGRMTRADRLLEGYESI